jgi:hypothetical protein
VSCARHIGDGASRGETRILISNEEMHETEMRNTQLQIRLQRVEAGVGEEKVV